MEKSKMSAGTWILIILVVLALGVGVYFIWPKANFDDAFNNVLELKTINQTQTLDKKDVKTYAEELLEFCKQTNLTTRAKQLEHILIIEDVQNLSNDYVLTSFLSMNKNSKDYATLNSSQNTALENVKKSHNDLINYIKGAYNAFLKLEQKPSAIVGEYASPFIEKYLAFIKAKAEFYELTATIVKTSTNQIIENNPLTITANSSIASAGNRLLNFDETNFDAYYTQSIIFKGLAQIYYDEDFYVNNFVLSTHTIENIKSALGDLAPTMEE